MTCIAGMVEGGKVWIGGDSAGLGEGFALTVRTDAKVFTNGPYIFGFTTSFRMGQLLRYSFQPPPAHPDEDLTGFMATTFVDAVRECLKAGGFQKEEDGVITGGNFLVGTAGRLFEIGNDYEVGESLDGVAAVGCGSDLALGALLALKDAEFVRPEDAIQAALSVAQSRCFGVRAPFKVISI